MARPIDADVLIHKIGEFHLNMSIERPFLCFIR